MTIRSNAPPDELLTRLAGHIGTPYWIYDAGVLRRRIDALISLARGAGLQARYAMKACSATRVVQEMHKHGLWIDAVSGNEVLRARRAGYAAGSDPPEILYTSDVFRDNGLDVIRAEGVLPNLGSPGMLHDLQRIDYRGPVALRANPGFGHGHVLTCATGGPGSKHGIWLSEVPIAARAATAAGMRVVMLHAHIGSGPRPAEFHTNMQQLGAVLAGMLPKLPDVGAVSLGGGIPHNYHYIGIQVDMAALQETLAEVRATLCRAAGRELRVEIEPGRYLLAPAGFLVARVAGVKRSQSPVKGLGVTFVMVDAGFNDLLRPAMYGAYHRISVVGKNNDAYNNKVVVAGPLCESGDVFTRGETGLLLPQAMPPPKAGDLLLIHDVGAYGYAMSSTYNSLGRAPQVWLEEDGAATLISRRETWQDLLHLETEERLW